MVKKILFVIIFLGVLFPAATQESGKKVLLAMENTKFKKALMEEMKIQLEKRSLEVTLVEDHKKNLKNFKASDYDYVFITNSGVQFKGQAVGS